MKVWAVLIVGPSVVRPLSAKTDRPRTHSKGVGSMTSQSILSEEWQPVVGCEHSYEISDLGRLRRSAPGGCTFVGRIRKPRPNRWGYFYAHLRLANGMRKTMMYHRMVLAAFVGPCPEGMEVNHIDGIKTNNSVENLEYVTPEENHQHATINGLVAKGTSVGASKLTEAEVMSIYELRGQESQRTVAGYFGVHRSTVRGIWDGRYWAWLTGAVHAE